MGVSSFFPPLLKYIFILWKKHKIYHLNQFFFFGHTGYDPSSIKRTDSRESAVSGLRQKRYKMSLEHLTVSDNQSVDNPIDQRMVSYC